MAAGVRCPRGGRTTKVAATRPVMCATRCDARRARGAAPRTKPPHTRRQGSVARSHRSTRTFAYDDVRGDASAGGLGSAGARGGAALVVRSAGKAGGISSSSRGNSHTCSGLCF
eukprot:356892-Chlamydomonas_euryale.AAC.3